MNKQEKIKELCPLLKDILERKEELITNGIPKSLFGDSNSLILITNNFTMRVLASALGVIEDEKKRAEDLVSCVLKFHELKKCLLKLFGMPFVVLDELDSKFGSNSESLQPYFEIHPIIKE
jgi:hypothetical protein